MNTIFNTGVSGMAAFQKEMDSVANNIANVNTNGYKPSRANFKELVYTDLDVNAETPKMSGHGVKLSDHSLDLGQGAMSPTGNVLDFAIGGDGYFAVDNDGVTEYTRNGEFRLSSEDRKLTVVTKDGSRVLNADGNAITLETNKETGQPDYSSLQDKIGVFQFDNPYGLERSSNGRFSETQLSGTPKTADDQDGEKTYRILSGVLETSGVDIGEEMVNVIEAQRAFQMSAKLVQTSDEIEEIVNNLR